MWNPMCCINPRWGTFLLGIQLSLMSISLLLGLLYIGFAVAGASLGHFLVVFVVGILIIAIAVMSFFLLIGAIKEEADKIKISLIIWAVIVDLFLILVILLCLPKSSKSESAAGGARADAGGGKPSDSGPMPPPPGAADQIPDDPYKEEARARGEDPDLDSDTSGRSRVLFNVFGFFFSEIFYCTWVVYAYYVELTGGSPCGALKYCPIEKVI